MLRVNVGLSRKLSHDFNSTGFSVNLDGEVTASLDDPERVIEQIHEFFGLAEAALQQQVASHRVGSESADSSEATVSLPVAPQRAANNVRPETEPFHNRSTSRQNGSGSQNDPAATDKQVQYLLSIARRKQLTTTALETEIAAILGRPVGVYELSKRDAGQVIDVMTNQPKVQTVADRF